MAHRIHDDIVKFSAAITPTTQECKLREESIQLVQTATQETFGSGVNVVPFGSYATGLASFASDIDVVLIGLMHPNSPDGYFGHKQGLVGQLLQQLEKHLMELGAPDIVHVQLIRHTKFPLLKFTTRSGVGVDVSINDDQGKQASEFVLEKTREYPALRPLCLVIKAFLRAKYLAEVHDGGLGGYSVANLLIAHLQETVKEKKSTDDFGELLISFFHRFGVVFDSRSQAVSVKRGGIVPKHIVVPAESPPAGWLSYTRKFDIYNGSRMERWYIENPITGCDVAFGSYNAHLVRQQFKDAFVKLNSLNCEDADGDSLSELFDVQEATRR